VLGASILHKKNHLRTNSVGSLTQRLNYVKWKKEAIDLQNHRKNVFNLFKRDIIKEKKVLMNEQYKNYKVNSLRAKRLIAFITL
jgi:hypothetical protein